MLPSISSWLSRCWAPISPCLLFWDPRWPAALLPRGFAHFGPSWASSLSDRSTTGAGISSPLVANPTRKDRPGSRPLTAFTRVSARLDPHSIDKPPLAPPNALTARGRFLSDLWAGQWGRAARSTRRRSVHRNGDYLVDNPVDCMEKIGLFCRLPSDHFATRSFIPSLCRLWTATASRGSPLFLAVQTAP